LHKKSKTSKVSLNSRGKHQSLDSLISIRIYFFFNMSKMPKNEQNQYIFYFSLLVPSLELEYPFD